ncbi:hypothetical protein DERP_005885 [Dermatophagoides pteronyssinus]|uniref:Uncharacterized protein n=1 Tax=Dermatophagoides pteronyssinus TaxID=6956 RepID=A0ABQ8J9Y6_DERPT|nr:hypothetical protein DERP_005885 [Dermatophagoides pteronyssinus]
MSKFSAMDGIEWHIDSIKISLTSGKLNVLNRPFPPQIEYMTILRRKKEKRVRNDDHDFDNDRYHHQRVSIAI